MLLAGYPALWRRQTGHLEADMGMFAALTTARTVTEDQITVLLSRDEWVTNTVPEKCNLGGISGGPIIGLFESDSHIVHHRLSGIITEHPDYASDFSTERIVGSVADVITENGNIY